MDGHNKEENLTLLISELFDWIEENQPNILYYQDINLRAAMERYFYFDAITNANKLKPLLDVAINWRIENVNSELSAVYDHYRLIEKQRGIHKKIYDSVIAWLRILGDYRSYFKSRYCSRDVSTEHPLKGNKIGLFAINDRFVHFFKDIDQQFNSEEKIYFSSHPNQIMESVLQACNTIAHDQKFKILFSKFSISPKHKLFPTYFRLSFFYQRIHTVLSCWQPGVLLFAEGTSHYDELASQAASHLNIPTVRVQSGRAGILHNGYINMSYNHMLCWSQAFVKRYQSVSPMPEYSVVGSPLMDEFYEQKEQQSNQVGQKKRVLIITQPISMHISRTDYQELIGVARTVLSLQRDVEMIVRRHPVDKSDGFELLSEEFPEQIIFMNYLEYSLVQVFSIADCCVGFFSTALSEAAACGVMTLTLQADHAHSVYPHPEKHGAAIAVNNSKEATHEILEILKNNDEYLECKKNMRSFSESFFGPNDGQSLTRTTDFIKHQLVKDK